MPYVDLWRSAVLIVITHGPLFQSKNRYYMVIIPKLLSAALVPLFQPKNSYHMVISPKLSSATQPEIGHSWSFFQNYHHYQITNVACSSIWLKPDYSQNTPRFCHSNQCRLFNLAERTKRTLRRAIDLMAPKVAKGKNIRYLSR